jgi:hypothetical protein
VVVVVLGRVVEVDGLEVVVVDRRVVVVVGRRVVVVTDPVVAGGVVGVVVAGGTVVGTVGGVVTVGGIVGGMVGFVVVVATTVKVAVSRMISPSLLQMAVTRWSPGAAVRGTTRLSLRASGGSVEGGW